MEIEQIDKSTIIHGLRFVILVSLLISAIIIIFTIEHESLRNIVSHLSLKYILFLLLIIITKWSFAGLRLKILVNSLGNKISFKDCLIIYLSGSFVSNVTPFASGGGPFQIYFLRKKGVNLGKSSVVVITQWILRLFFFGLITPVFLIFFNRAISPGIIPGYIFYLAFGIGLFISFSIIIFALVPEVTDTIIEFIMKIKVLNNFIENSFRAKRWIIKAKDALKEFRFSLQVMGENKKGLILGGLCTVVFWSLFFSVIPIILMGLGAEPRFLQAYIMQSLFYLILPFMPTPGATGVAEAGSASIFITFIPKNLLGLVVFGWRLFTFHLVLLIGGFFAFREIGDYGSNDEHV